MIKTTLISIAVLLVSVSMALAGTGPANVSNTPHNLSSASYPGDFMYTYAAGVGNEDQVCVFCHTPHGGSLDAPLWNRDLSSLQGAGVFTHYTSSTLSSTVGVSTRGVNPESLMCLSCHDGSIGMGDSLYNTSNTTGTPDNNIVKMQAGFGNPGPRIGASIANMPSGLDPAAGTGDLSDDHPISFSYTAAYGDATNAGDLHLVGDVEAAGLALFGAGKNLECATCHDPHVDYLNPANAAYDPFLAIPNTGSDMCLTCHIK